MFDFHNFQGLRYGTVTSQDGHTGAPIFGVQIVRSLLFSFLLLAGNNRYMYNTHLL